MQKKSTENLENELKDCESLDSYLKENEKELAAGSLEGQIQALIEVKGMTRAEVVRDSNLNEIYAYQIISGTRRPSRDKLICLCFAMKADIEETQNLLQRNDFAPLYARNRRDSIIIFALTHDKTIIELNSDLYDHGEPVLE